MGFIELLYDKNQRLCIFVAKRRSTQLYSRKNMFWYKKTAISFFVALYPYLSLIVAKIRFSMLVKKLRCWTFISEKKCFCFVIAKRRCTQFYTTKHMFWFACCNSGLFSVLLHQKKVFFQYAAIYSHFHLILLKQRFSFLLAKLPCFRIVFSRTTFFSVFVTKLHFGHYITEKMFWSVGN